MWWTNLIDALEQHLLPCGFKQLTGLPCPGCGMQRAFIALLRGDLGASIVAHPGLLPFLLTLCYTLLHLRFNYQKGARNVLVFFCLTVSLMIANYFGRSGLFG